MSASNRSTSRQPVRYDVVIDRLTHWYGTSREWIKKAVVMDGLYVFNNPWSIQSNEKHTSYCAMMRLGMPIPTTWMVPPKGYEPKPDLEVTLQRYASMFDLVDLGNKVGYPMYIKPYDGGGWAGVSRIDSAEDLQRLYDESGTYLMHLQNAVDPHDLFIRCIGLGPQVRVVRYDPGAALHDRYTSDDGGVPDDQRQHLIDTTLTINSFFGWDFNSCEALRQGTSWFPIDFANPCPDSQVTSLHYHFPWLIGANLRWSLFCAATNRPMRPNLEWQPYFDIADTDAPYEEKLKGYAAIARKRLQTDGVRGVLRRAPVRPRPGPLGVLRNRDRPGRGPTQGRGDVSRPRGRLVHRDVLVPHPAVATRTRNRDQARRTMALPPSRSHRSSWRDGAISVDLCSSFPPPAVTPMRSNASSWSAPAAT